uniref:Uncharacterized protein n=1 Tax=viral metagenome TaxID=1070528 RepID=A0A6C0JJN8_9ZZZZ
MGGRQSNPVANWFNDIADRARRAAEAAAARARQLAEQAMQQARVAEQNAQVNSIRSRRNDMLNKNNDLQTRIYNKRNLLRSDSERDTNIIFGLNANIDVQKNENAKIEYENKNLKDIKNNNDEYNAAVNVAGGISNNLKNRISLILNQEKIYTAIQNENNTIVDTMPELIKQYSSDNPRIDYEKKPLSDLDNVNTILFILYYVLFLIFSFIIIFFNQAASKYSKFAILFILLVYPLVINKIQKVLYLGLVTLYLTLENNVYHNTN